MFPQIAPSLLAADFYNLAPQLEAVAQAGVSMLHVDVMDGHFVPNISLGMPVIAAIAKKSGLQLDVHLMITDPARYLKQFVDAGAHWLTVHYEAIAPESIIGVLTDIRQLGVKAGLSIRPDTDVAVLRAYVPHCDMVLMMTVQPGFGGQRYDVNGDARIRQASEICKALNPNCVLSVDGGIDTTTIGGAFQSGAQLLVAGSAVFGTPDPAAAVRNLLAKCQ